MKLPTFENVFATVWLVGVTGVILMMTWILLG